MPNITLSTRETGSKNHLPVYHYAIASITLIKEIVTTLIGAPRLLLNQVTNCLCLRNLQIKTFEKKQKKSFIPTDTPTSSSFSNSVPYITEQDLAEEEEIEQIMNDLRDEWVEEFAKELEDLGFNQ